MEILELYKSILASGGATVGEEGHVSVPIPGEDPVALMVDGKRLALPTTELLRAGSFNPDGGLIAFHPISENVALDPSIVYQKLEELFTYRLNVVMRELILQLSLIAQDKDVHPNLSSAERGLLMAMPNAKRSTFEDLEKLMRRASSKGPHRLASIYVRRGGTYAGATVSRLGRYVMSMMKDLDETARLLWGVSLAKRDIPEIKALIEYILPDYEDAEVYSRPSNSQVAPNLHALLRTFSVVAKRLNKVVETHYENLNGAENLVIPMDWVDEITDLSIYRGFIPTLPGNDGTAKPGSTIAQPIQTVRGTVVAGEEPKVKLSERLGQRANPRYAPGSVEAVIAGLTGGNRNSGVSRAVEQPRRWSAMREQSRGPDLPPWVEDDRPSGSGSTWTNIRGGYTRGSGGGGVL